MRDVFDIILPDRSPLKVRRSADRPGGRPTHYVHPVNGGPDVIVATASLSTLSRVLEAYNRTFDPPAKVVTYWAVSAPRRGGGWVPLLGSLSHSRRSAIAFFEQGTSTRYRRAKRIGYRVKKYILNQAET